MNDNKKETEPIVTATSTESSTSMVTEIISNYFAPVEQQSPTVKQDAQVVYTEPVDDIPDLDYQPRSHMTGIFTFVIPLIFFWIMSKDSAPIGNRSTLAVQQPVVFDWFSPHAPPATYVQQPPLSPDMTLNWTGIVYDRTLYEHANRSATHDMVLYVTDDRRTPQARMTQRFLRPAMVRDMVSPDLKDHVLKWCANCKTWTDHGHANPNKYDHVVDAPVLTKEDGQAQAMRAECERLPKDDDRHYEDCWRWARSSLFIRWTNQFSAGRQVFHWEPMTLWRGPVVLVDCDQFKLYYIGQHTVHTTDEVLGAIRHHIATTPNVAWSAELTQRIIEPWQSVDGRVSLRYGHHMLDTHASAYQMLETCPESRLRWFF